MVWFAKFPAHAAIAADTVPPMDSAKYCAAHAAGVGAGARLRRRFAGDDRLHGGIGVLFICTGRRDGRLAQLETDNVRASASVHLPDSRSIKETE
jgi:hypothetical protein